MNNEQAMEYSGNCRVLIIVVAVVWNPTTGRMDCQQQSATIIHDTMEDSTMKSNRNHSEFMGQAESFALGGTNATNVALLQPMWRRFNLLMQIHHMWFEIHHTYF